jgi:NADP-dependent 3-hydroxy acid dehydrogenase YdfG
VALITGGGSGMGRLMALRIAQAGGKVAIVDVNDEGLRETSSHSQNIRPFRCDVTDPAALGSVAGTVVEEWGKIDRLAVAAGIMPALTIADMPAGKFSQVMRINYEGMVNAVKAVLPHMQARNSGEIVLFGSLAGVVFSQNFAAYGASKAAVNAFGEVLAAELKGSGVKVLTVRPGAVDTPLIDQATGNGGLAGLRKQKAKGQMASPEQILDAVEAGLGAGKDVVYPTADAKFAQWLRRFSPALMWRLVNAAGR